MKITEWIIPTTDLQTDLVAVVQKAQQRPLIITDEGRPKLCLLSVEVFDAMVERLAELEEAELATNIAIGEQQFEQGEFLPLKDAIAELETRWQQRSAQ